MIEAMACGTPVIAYDGGAVSEVIEEGRTGFIVKEVEGATRLFGEFPNSVAYVVAKCLRSASRRLAWQVTTSRRTSA